MESHRNPAIGDDLPSSFDRPIAVLDFEASGLGAGTYPIEVGVSIIGLPSDRHPGGMTAKPVSWLIAPTKEWLEHGKWDMAAQAIHGIDQDSLVGYGMAATQVASALEKAVAGCLVVADGVDEVDDHCLRRLYAAAGRKPPFALEPIEPLFHDLISDVSEIDEAKAKALALFPVRHRAGDDARRIAEVLRILRDEYVRGDR